MEQRKSIPLPPLRQSHPSTQLKKVSLSENKSENRLQPVKRLQKEEDKTMDKMNQLMQENQQMKEQLIMMQEQGMMGQKEIFRIELLKVLHGVKNELNSLGLILTDSNKIKLSESDIEVEETEGNQEDNPEEDYDEDEDEIEDD